MKRAKRLLAILLALTLVAVLAVACKTEEGSSGGDETLTLSGKDIYKEDIKIMYISLSTAGVTNRMTELAFNDVIQFYPKITVNLVDPGYDPNKQIEFIEQAITQQYDAILIEAMDPVGTKGPIEEAEKAGIPVITINLNSQAVHTMHIQGNDYNSGYKAGEVLGNALGGTGKVLSFDGPSEQAETNRMCPGFADAIKDLYPGIELLENSYTDGWQKDVARANMTSLLAKYPQIDGVYCASDDIADGVISAIEAAGRSDEIKVYGSMGYPDALLRIRAGTQFGTYFSDGYVEYSTALYMALYFVQNGITGYALGYTATPVVDQPTTPVTQENVETIIEISHWKDADPTTWR